jgi:hypothetical protein
MSILHKTEKMMVEQFSKVPFHLPTDVRRWLGENIWWLMIVGVVLSALAIVNLIQAIFLLGAITAFSGVLAPLSGMALVSTWVSIIQLVVMIILGLIAIKPLRAKTKRGWDLMLIMMLVGLLGSVLSIVVGGSIIAAVFSALLTIAIGGYFLTEVRIEFRAKKASE